MRRRTTFLHDDSGMVVVVAVFMAAALVGCIWYMFGLGEAMVYREQLRAATDATAFASATLDAVGMNIVSMINIAMAVVLSVLVMLQIVFLLGLLATFALLAGEIWFGIDTPATIAAIDFDIDMFDLIEDVQEPIFMGIAALNVTAGVEGMLAPWASLAVAREVPQQYKSARVPDGFQPFSLSLIPTRIPFLFNWAIDKATDKTTKGVDELIKKKSPALKKLIGEEPIEINPLGAVAAVSKYGLPITDDSYEVLCGRAGVELVQEFEYLTPMGLIAQSLPYGDVIFDDVAHYFGLIIGKFPEVFCSGLDPIVMLDNGVDSALSRIDFIVGLAGKVPGVSKVVKPIKKFRRFLEKVKDYSGKAKDDEPWTKTMFPMKTFPLYENGNLFGQVWATIPGDDAPTLGAITGVSVSTWGATASTPQTGDEKKDYAEAEFYYECGKGALRPVAGWDPFGLSPNDSSGEWGDCAPNAMWNMFWRARLVRWQGVEIPVLEGIKTAIEETALDSTIDWFADKFEFGPAKYVVKKGLEKVVDGCFSSVGKGGFGECPMPVGLIPWDGTVKAGDTAPDGRPADAIYH